MALIVMPSLLRKRPWARIRARCEASFFIVFSKSIRCCSVRGRTYLTLIDLDIGCTSVLFWSYRDNIILYFPVKRVVFMPPRACHSVPLFLAAVCGGRERPLASAQWGRAFCGVAQAAPPSLHNALRPGAAGVCLTSASVPDPRSPWAAPAGSPRHTSRWPRPPRQVRAAAADFLGQRRIDAPLPASVWPSTAALRPASDRDRRPAGRRLSTAARCSTGVARQNADHG